GIGTRRSIEEGLDPRLHPLQAANVEISVSLIEEPHELIEAFSHPVLDVEPAPIGGLLLATEGEEMPIAGPVQVGLELPAIKAFGLGPHPEEEPDLAVPPG